MSITLFSIVFPIMIIGMLALLFMNVQTLSVVKAGKVTKMCKERRHSANNLYCSIDIRFFLFLKTYNWEFYCVELATRFCR